MNHTGTIGQSYVGITGHKECFLILLCRTVICTLIKWLILFIFQIFSRVCLQDLICRLVFLSKLAKNRIQQCSSHIVNKSVCAFYLRIFFIRIYTETDIGRQCPWCCGPCKDICILILHFESYNSGALFYILISLSNLLSGQRRTTARAVRNDLKSLIKKTLIPDLLQSPPLGLNKVIIIGYIRIIHISPETNGVGEILPHPLVFPYAFLTFVDKWFQTVFLDLFFSIQSKKLFHFQLYRKTMGIPSCLSRNHVALHGAVSRDHVLDNTGQYVSDMRFSVCCRRSVIKGIGLTFFAVLHTFFKNVIFFPELLCGFLTIHELKVRRNFLIHLSILLLPGGVFQ